MHLRTGILFMLTSFIGELQAQEFSDEHRYLFAQQGLTSTLQQKQLISRLRATDPDAVISMAPDGGHLKVLTHAPLDIGAFADHAGTLGIQLQLRPLGRTGRLEVGEQDQ
jgi:hypothetical protein